MTTITEDFPVRARGRGAIMPRMQTWWLALILAVMPGCFDLTEEVWINKDYSGRVKMDMGVSEPLLLMASDGSGSGIEGLRAEYQQMQRELEAKPNVSAARYEEYEQDDVRHFVLDVELEDVRDAEAGLVAIFERTASVTMLGGNDENMPESTVRLERTDNGNILFSQLLSAHRTEFAEGMRRMQAARREMGGYGMEQVYGDMERGLGAGMLSSMFGNQYIRVTLHAPDLVVSNGTMNAERDAVTWKVSLVTLLTRDPFQQDLRAEFRPPTPLILRLLPVVAVGVVLAVLFARMRHSIRRGREAATG